MNILNAEKISKTYGEKVLFDKVVLGVNKGDKTVSYTHLRAHET